nr:MAG TPA: repressor domain protein [Caudoviricetes sp.]
MNEIQIFNNPDFGTVRTLDDNGVILFAATDVAKILGYSNPYDAISRHCKGVVKHEGVSQTTNQHGVTTNQTVEMSFIPESDLYRLVFGSKLPSAEKFTDWVTSDVLPSIRKNGGYIAGQQELSPQELMAKALLVANKTLAEREARISELTVQNNIMAPKAEYFDELVDRNMLTSFRDTAKELGIKPKAFVDWLLAKKFIYRDQKGKLMPREDKNSGLFEVKEAKNDKTQWSGVQTLITPKGRETFRLLYL